MPRLSYSGCRCCRSSPLLPVSFLLRERIHIVENHPHPHVRSELSECGFVERSKYTPATFSLFRRHHTNHRHHHVRWIRIRKFVSLCFATFFFLSTQQMLNSTLHAPATPSQSRHIPVEVREAHIIELSQLLGVPLFRRSVVGWRRRCRRATALGVHA